MGEEPVNGGRVSKWGRDPSVGRNLSMGEGPVHGGGACQWGRDYFLNNRDMQSEIDANMFEAPVE